MAPNVLPEACNCFARSNEACLVARRGASPRSPEAGGSWERPTQWLDGCHLPFNAITQVLQQMKAVGDLPRLRRALAYALRVEPASITADNLDLGTLLEPFRCLFSGAGPQHIDDGPALQVNDDRPIVESLALAPIVNCNDAERIGAAIRSRTPLELPKNGRVACLHAKTAQQPFADAAAGGMTEEPHKLADAARSPSKGGSARQFLDEGFLPAFLVAASLAAYTQLDDYRRALERQILQAPVMPTVPQRRLRRAPSLTPIP